MRVYRVPKRRSSRATAVCAAILVFLAFVPGVLADRDAAVYFSGRGDKALQEKDWVAAEEHYRKAIEEDETYLPARLGLAEALLGAEKRAAAIEEFRTCVRECEKAPDSKETQTILETARKRIKEIDEAGSALEEIIDSHVKELLALARRWKKKDPQLFEVILRRILKLRPDNAAAVTLLEKAGMSATSKTVSLFNGRDLTGWSMGFPTFQVKDGMIIAEIRDSAIMGRSETYCKGDFDIRAEMKFLEARPGPPLFGLIGGFRGDMNYCIFGFLTGMVTWEDYTDGTDSGRRTILAKQPEAFGDPILQENWNTFELQFRGREIIAVVNGKVIAKDRRPPERDEGFVGIIVQNAKVAFKKIEVTRR